MSERHTHASAHGRPKWPVRAMVTCALLTAVSVVLARFLIPTPNEVTRFSLEAVPIFLAGMLFGPLPGALTGFAADFIGCLFSPYGYNPIFCVPPILYGLCAGLFRPWLTRRCSPLRLALAFLPPVILGSVLYQSFALAMIYGGGAKAAYFLTRLAARSVQFAITGVLDVLVVWLLQRSGALRAVGLPPVQSKGNDIQWRLTKPCLISTPSAGAAASRGWSASGRCWR